ncbi:Hsp70 chaperone protein [Fusarium denticulatum]|uniref:Hsp70 chaperone protein n=1 Tax=Fusarium denticulatum TaxID=48507 RepID=A0A8H5XGK8_9HYPO|nr:Hsp70 chaperone protein [Fusarium denticulatum]
MTTNRPLDDAIIVGIDFGLRVNRYSGVAWAYSREPEDIEIVTSWESELNHCSDVEKAPTQIHYGHHNRDIKWGYGIPPEHEPLKWFKLLLLEPKDILQGTANSTQLKEALRLQGKAGKEPVEIVACFLQKIWDHSVESIRRTIGDDVMKRSNFQVVITLPATWPPYAEHRMKVAAKQAGILDPRPAGPTTLRFVSEPEAAALATIKDLSKRSSIKLGIHAITKDLISYVFQSTDPFVVKECVKGEGDLCGGVFLDEAFIKFVKIKSPRGTWRSVTKTEERKFLNDEWEHGIKPQFENQKRIWSLTLPDTCVNPSSRGLMRRMILDLTSQELFSVFSPIVNKIEVLVRRQVDANHIKYHEKPKGLVRRDPFANLGVEVETRVARTSYGIKYTTPFMEGHHNEADKVWSHVHQNYRAENQMAWFLKERYGDSDGIHHLCTMKWDKIVDVHTLPKWTNPVTVAYPRLDYHIKMDCEEGTVDFSVHYQGSKVGEEEAEVQFN